MAGLEFHRAEAEDEDVLGKVMGERIVVDFGNLSVCMYMYVYVCEEWILGSESRIRF